MLFTTFATAQNSYVSGGLFFQTEFDSEAMKGNATFEYGTFLKEKSAIGAALKYQYEKDKNFEHVIIIEPYYRKYIWKNEKYGFFCDGVAGITISLPQEGDTGLGFKIGLAPGFDCKLTEKMYFVSRFGFIGYYQPGDFDGKKYLRLSCDATNITFGLRYQF